MKKIIIAFVFLLAFILLINYYFYQISSGVPNSKWIVESITNTELVENSNISLEFTDNKILGNGGVNTYSCSYKLRNTLTISNCESTEMASANSLINDLESKYLLLLTKVKYYKLDGNVLTLQDSEHKSLIILRRNGE